MSLFDAISFRFDCDIALNRCVRTDHLEASSVFHLRENARVRLRSDGLSTTKDENLFMSISKLSAKISLLTLTLTLLSFIS